MSRTDLTAVVRVQIEIALVNAMERSSDLAALEEIARKLGLSGAEIDAAKRGRSFDAVIDVSVGYALALYHGDRERIAVAEQRLARFDLSCATSDIADLLTDCRNRGNLNTDWTGD